MGAGPLAISDTDPAKGGGDSEATVEPGAGVKPVGAGRGAGAAATVSGVVRNAGGGGAASARKAGGGAAGSTRNGGKGAEVTVDLDDVACCHPDEADAEGSGAGWAATSDGTSSNSPTGQARMDPSRRR